MINGTIKTKVTRKKKRGFTLVELIAVMAIIAILSAVLAPKVLGYINEGKKTSATEEARQVVLAIESYNIKATGTDVIEADDTFSDFGTRLNGKDYITSTELKAIGTTNTYKELKEIVKGTKNFTLNTTTKTIEITP